MSAIIPNPLTTGLSAAPPSFDFERQGSALSAALTPTYRERRDAVGFGQIGFTSRSPCPANDGSGEGMGYQSPCANGGQSQFMDIISQLFESISSLFSQLGSMIGFGAQGSKQPTSPVAGQEQRFGHAAASSVGDPHESFNGTTSGDKVIDGRWDSMTSHHNLLGSNSFDGGYRIANTVTQPGTHGVTTNDRVTVTTNGGDTNVAMNKDGSYDVSAFGHQIDLTVGKATHVNDGETVTKNADGSLTIDDSNGRGGTIATTLRGTGGGVDVNSVAENVNLGGYLVDRRDGDVDSGALFGRDGYGSGLTLPPVDATAPSFMLPQDANVDRTQPSLAPRYVAQAYEPEADESAA